jgi:hypothetical protein
LLQSDGDAQQGGLAGPVFADQSVNLTRSEAEMNSF